ncbi:MAG: CAAX amino protease [Phycisphaerae bacterium]|jgi:hypothetical protein
MSRSTGKLNKYDAFLFPPPDSVAGQHYFYVTQRPWPSLLFILPMLVIFEVGTWLRFHGSAGRGPQLVAPFLIEWLVNALGAQGQRFPTLLTMAPGLLLVAILLGWHVAARHPWRVDLVVLATMLGESLFWTIPLFVFGRVLLQSALLDSAAAREAWIDTVIRSFGAGIYEELVFRLICITALVLLLIDILRLPRTPTAIFIILFSAGLFAAHHHPPLGADEFRITSFAFRTLAGLYLAGLFVYRGFGIAAGSHAFYNIIVATIKAIH